ncbi:unnamed protein product [Amoebophrya sp. A25]|nr:unnamed protein product [Amoebophrya sp. A25]|eukprot:GSA25T00015295001.1
MDAPDMQHVAAAPGAARTENQQAQSFHVTYVQQEAQSKEGIEREGAFWNLRIPMSQLKVEPGQCVAVQVVPLRRVATPSYDPQHEQADDSLSYTSRAGNAKRRRIAAEEVQASSTTQTIELRPRRRSSTTGDAGAWDSVELPGELRTEGHTPAPELGIVMNPEALPAAGSILVEPGVDPVSGTSHEVGKSSALSPKLLVGSTGDVSVRYVPEPQPVEFGEAGEIEELGETAASEKEDRQKTRSVEEAQGGQMPGAQPSSSSVCHGDLVPLPSCLSSSIAAPWIFSPESATTAVDIAQTTLASSAFHDDASRGWDGESFSAVASSVAHANFAEASSSSYINNTNHHQRHYSDQVAVSPSIEKGKGNRGGKGRGKSYDKTGANTKGGKQNEWVAGKKGPKAGKPEQEWPRQKKRRGRAKANATKARNAVAEEGLQKGKSSHANKGAKGQGSKNTKKRKLAETMAGTEETYFHAGDDTPRLPREDGPLPDPKDATSSATSEQAASLQGVVTSCRTENSSTGKTKNDQSHSAMLEKGKAKAEAPPIAPSSKTSRATSYSQRAPSGRVEEAASEALGSRAFNRTKAPKWLRQNAASSLCMWKISGSSSSSSSSCNVTQQHQNATQHQHQVGTSLSAETNAAGKDSGSTLTTRKASRSGNQPWNVLLCTEKAKKEYAEQQKGVPQGEGEENWVEQEWDDEWDEGQWWSSSATSRTGDRAKDWSWKGPQVERGVSLAQKLEMCGPERTSSSVIGSENVQDHSIEERQARREQEIARFKSGEAYKAYERIRELRTGCPHLVGEFPAEPPKTPVVDPKMSTRKWRYDREHWYIRVTNYVKAFDIVEVTDNDDSSE